METSMERYVFLNINKTHDSLFKPDNMKVSSPSSQLINQSNEAPGVSQSASHYESPRAMAMGNTRKGKIRTFGWKTATSAWTGKPCVDCLSPRLFCSTLKLFSRL